MESLREREIPANLPASSLSRDELKQIRCKLLLAVQAEMRIGEQLLPSEARPRIEAKLTETAASQFAYLAESDRRAAVRQALDEVAGFGPVQILLDDPSVTEVMVNRFDRVYAERSGRSGLTEVRFDDDAHVRRVIERIVSLIGRHMDSKNPLCDARLPDGSRVNAVIPPCAIDGCNLTIRKFPAKRLMIEDLVGFGAMSQAMADLLRACVVSRINIVVSGGTGSGKTTLLNVLSSFIPTHERIVTIEDAAELQLGQEQVVRLETRKPDPDGTGTVSIRDLVRNALRMRPDRIVVGECRGGETLDMLQAMNTGHDGSLTTLHANAPRDAISRIETMALMGGLELPVRAIREQLAAAVQLIIQINRLRDGSRKLTHITEIAGIEGDKVVMQDLFRFHEDGQDEEGKVNGSLRPSGLRPTFQNKLEAHGFKLPAEIFTQNDGAAERRNPMNSPAAGDGAQTLPPEVAALVGAGEEGKKRRWW